jgi:hypothetical protein
VAGTSRIEGSMDSDDSRRPPNRRNLVLEIHR